MSDSSSSLRSSEPIIVKCKDSCSGGCNRTFSCVRNGMNFPDVYHSASDVGDQPLKKRKVSDTESETESVHSDADTPCLPIVVVDGVSHMESAADIQVETPCVEIPLPTEEIVAIDLPGMFEHVQGATRLSFDKDSETPCVLEPMAGGELQSTSQTLQFCESVSLACRRDASGAPLEQTLKKDWPDVAEDVAEVRKRLIARGFASSCCLLAVLQKPGAEEHRSTARDVCGIYYQMSSNFNSRSCFQMVLRGPCSAGLVCRGVYFHWSRRLQNFKIGALDDGKDGLATRIGSGTSGKWLVWSDRTRLMEVG